MGRRRSFAEAVAFRQKFLRRLALVFIVLVAFDSFRATFLSSHEVVSVSMMPAFAPGDRLFATPLPYGPRTVFGKLPGLIRPRRGDIVLASLPHAPQERFLPRLLDSLVRLITLQRISTLYPESELPSGSVMLKRVIALPGDTVLMEDGQYRIKTPGSSIFRSETEVSGKRYRAGKESVIPGWIKGLPGSGYMAARTLGPGEYFLAGDSRTESSDSRHWGPVKSESLVAFVLFRYWPLSRLGAP